MASRSSSPSLQVERTKSSSSSSSPLTQIVALPSPLPSWPMRSSAPCGPSASDLPHPRVEHQIPIVFQPQTRLEEHFQPVSLPIERVDNVCSRFDERRFEHERQQGKNRVEWFELCIGAIDLPVSDSSEEFSEDREVEYEWSSEERVFTFVEDVLRRVSGPTTKAQIGDGDGDVCLVRNETQMDGEDTP